MDINAKPGLFTLSVDARKLADRLLEVPEGEIITWPQIVEVLGSFNRGYISTARHLCEQDRVHFEAVWRVGLRRLTNEDKTNAAVPVRAKMHRAIRRGMVVVASVDYDKLSKEKQVQHNTSAAFLGFMGYLLKPKALKTIESAVTKRGSVIPPISLLDAFKDK